MIAKRAIGVILLAGVLVGCDSAVTPPPSHVAAQPSIVTAAGPSVSPSPLRPASPSPSPSPTATTAPTATPAPTPAPTPVPWLTYTSKLFRYSMKYPPTWVVTPGSAKLSDQYDGYGYPYVYVDRSTGANLSVSLTVTHEIAYSKSHIKAKLISNKSIKLAGGFAGRILVLEGVEDGRKVTLQQVIVAKGSVGYFIDMYSERERAAPDKVLFRHIYATWRPR